MEINKYHIGGILTIIFALLTLITGSGILFFTSLAICLVTGFFFLFTSKYDRLNYVIGMIAIVLISSSVIILFVANFETTTIIDTYHEMYTVTAPFGVIYVNQTGDMSGSLFYTKGSFESTLSETYIAKYMEGNQLRTITTNTPIIVDGNFTLQEHITIIEYKNSIYHEIKSNKTTTEWIIHIPSLPSLNQTLNNDYTIIP